ncbi:hypothetical protein NDU88_007551 [Pleurodeles waltl]|uniref:Uncharacterized protein n=1 Tax=Pleurodeles waltl TaxID=8319 RepID=A0AAV7MIA8_PLEWA|nr:hypothetical protein NDU88_007551 [Pleurodeles waltl]
MIAFCFPLVDKAKRGAQTRRMVEAPTSDSTTADLLVLTEQPQAEKKVRRSGRQNVLEGHKRAVTEGRSTHSASPLPSVALVNLWPRPSATLDIHRHLVDALHHRKRNVCPIVQLSIYQHRHKLSRLSQ